jgi:capsular exopolysaccharide synthesis family protein
MKAHRLVTTTEGGDFLEAFKILRTQILHHVQEHQWNVIGVTSPGSGEGKTLVAANVAMTMAMDPNHTALLVDANLRNPQVHHLFGLENKGLADFLLDHASFSDLLIHPQIERLVVLPAGGPLQHSVEALALPKMRALMEEMKHRYSSRIVFVDLPPLLDMADVLALAPMLDAVLLVVEAGRTTENDLFKSLALLQGNIPLLGAVLNKAR